MNLLDHTRASPAENLALDEALLDTAEQDDGGEILRLWEPVDWFVVVGYANHVAREVNDTACAADGIPILRRCSGGGTVLQGPGCLNYALILDGERDGRLSAVAGTNRYVMDRHRQMLETLLGRPVVHDGHTDLAVAGRKCSGNSQRRRRRFLLFHGSFLLGLDLDRVERYLPLPSREPGYRQRRSHREFLVNLPLAPAVVRDALARAWQATVPAPPLPEARLRELVHKRYGTDAWHRKFG
ncbi:lipoate--protein ligase family protein [bacterium]|nr:lipoate--protein ligase family protein [bacterium]